MATIAQMKEFIDQNVRTRSSKTGRKIKVNTYGYRKSNLKDLVKMTKAEKSFDAW